MAVPGDLADASRDGIEHEAGVLVGQALEDTLDNVVAVGVDAETGGLGGEGLGDGRGGVGVEGAHLDHLLD